MTDATATRPFRELCRLTGRAIARYRLIRAGDRILLGLSGGKDSLMLAHVLHQLQRRAPISFELLCVTVDPGFPEFGTEALQTYCREQGWQHEVTTLPIARLLAKAPDRMPCVLCSRLRRGRLYTLAAERNCPRLALGHHFDDLAASFLISLFRGQGLSTMGPSVRARQHPVRVIRPFALAPESLILEAAAAFGLPSAGKCPYAGSLEREGDRAWARNLLDEVAGRMPQVRAQMLHSLQKVELKNLLDERFLELDE